MPFIDKAVITALTMNNITTQIAIFIITSLNRKIT